MDTLSIKPTPRRIGRVELCGLDMAGCRYFESIAIFSPALDVERLRDALTRSLDLYPFLAGTLIQDGKRVFVDLDGPGLQFAYEESRDPCPAWGPGLTHINVPHLFLPAPPRDMAVPDHRVFGKPLLFAKLTRFASGHYVLGTSICHVVCDGKGAHRWFADLHHLYAGEQITEPPEFSREAVVSLADPNAESPTPGSGFVAGAPAYNDLRERAIEPVYTYFPLPDEQRGMLISLAAKEHSLGVSEHDLLHALILKSFAHATPRTMTHVALDQPYDARRVKDLGFPANYVGNAVLHRLLPLPRAEAIDASPVEIATTLAEIARPTAALARHDIGFKQREYNAGRVGDYCNLTHAHLAMGKGTLLVSNMAQSSRQIQAPFGGTMLWVDLALNEPMGVRSAWIFGNSSRKDSHRMLVVLPDEQVGPFKAAWEAGMAELTAPSVSRKARATGS